MAAFARAAREADDSVVDHQMAIGRRYVDASPLERLSVLGVRGGQGTNPSPGCGAGRCDDQGTGEG